MTRQKKLRNKKKIGDIIKIQSAYKNKVEEYSKMSLEELKKLFETKRIGGSHRAAMLEVVRQKLQDQAIANNEVVSELPE